MSAQTHSNVYYIAAPMRCRTFLTELKLDSYLPPKMQLWLAASLFVAVLYVLRTFNTKSFPVRIYNLMRESHLLPRWE